MEKMVKMKEAGNYFMRANAKPPPRRTAGNPMARSDPELPNIKNKPANQNGYHSLTPNGTTNSYNSFSNNNQQSYTSNQNSMNFPPNNNNNNNTSNYGNHNSNGFDFYIWLKWINVLNTSNLKDSHVLKYILTI